MILMNGSMRYATIKTSRQILEELHRDNRRQPFFVCDVYVDVMGEDTGEQAVLTLYIERVYERPEDLRSSNGDLYYTTRARLATDGVTFPVTLEIASRQASIASATVSISDEVENAL